jgi:tetratricopeptide (TPR) repeat protein
LESAVRAGDPAAAAAALEATTTRDGGSPDPVRDATQGVAIDRFWRAQAYALTGRVAEASALFTSLTADPKNTYFQEAVLSHGALWAARGETARALQALAPGLVTDDPARAAAVRLRMAELHLAQNEITEARTILQPAAPSLERAALEARAAWMQGRMEEAAQLAGPVAAQAPAGAARDTARLVQARVKAAGGQILEADRGLLEWVRAEPTTVPLAAVILALEEFDGLEAEEVNTLLTEWQGDPRSALAPPAAYGRAAAAARQGQTGPAAEAFAAFAAAHDTHPLAPAARFRSVELALAAGMPEQARTWAESWRAHPSLTSGSAEAAQAAFAAGLAAWQAQDAAAAATAFEEAAQHAPDRGIEQAARLNAALCAVQAGATPPSNGLEPWPDADATILFEAGLHGARTHHPEAASWLEKFLATHAGTNAGTNGTGNDTRSPDTHTDPRPAAAWTALAELELARPPPPKAAARPHAHAARRASVTSTAAEEADWLAIVIEETAAAWPAAMEKAAQFLTTWPASNRRAEIRFKRASWLGRQDRWTDAINEYTALAAEIETPPAAAGRALYLAGLAELNLPSPDSLDRAIDRWRDAAALDESLVFPARYQQALAKSRLGKMEEALQQLETLLIGPPIPSGPQQSAIELTRGELLLAGTETPERTEAALISLQRVIEATPPGALRHTRAMSRKGEALIRLGRIDDALSTLTEAAQPLLSPPLDAPALSGDEILWPARAGLAAVALLESQNQWPQAAAMAQQLAATPGPHAEPARAKAARLRLEHFIWEE